RLDVLDAVDPDPRHGRAGHDREQGSPERVADGQRVALLEGFGDEPAVPVTQNLPLDLLRPLKWNTWHSLPYWSRASAGGAPAPRRPAARTSLAVELDDELLRGPGLGVVAPREGFRRSPPPRPR